MNNSKPTRDQQKNATAEKPYMRNGWIPATTKAERHETKNRDDAHQPEKKDDQPKQAKRSQHWISWKL